MYSTALCSGFFLMYNFRGFAEALNQGENVDLDALMADLSSIEQELSTINSKPNSSMARLGLTDTKVHKKHIQRIKDSLSVPDIWVANCFLVSRTLKINRNQLSLL